MNTTTTTTAPSLINRTATVLGFETWTGLTFAELYHAGRLGSDPSEAIDQIIGIKWPAQTVGGHRFNCELRQSVLDYLSKFNAPNH